MAMIDTHPDYLVDERIFARPRGFLEPFSADATAWTGAPARGQPWWRRRAASSTRADGRGLAGRGAGRSARAGRVRTRSLVRARLASAGAAGALVIGGDYQGLGIVRSLGRRGMDVVVIDDERSISRPSRFVARCFAMPRST